MSGQCVYDSLLNLKEQGINDLGIRLENLLSILTKDKKENVLNTGSQMRFDVARSVFLDSEEAFYRMIVISEVENTLMVVKECIDEIGMNPVSANLIIILINKNSASLTEEDFFKSFRKIFKENHTFVMEETFKEFEKRMETTLSYYSNSKTDFEEESKNLKELYACEILLAIIDKVIKNNAIKYFKD